ncbi:MAG: TetR/AcrR family transcriptional regulator [Methanobrevibacter sp.]|uniref:TetR/AcrR family transcriptional regulator n=1 Tax=Methanobrevibacter sp. TaxID=66852 RepID=UPI0025E57494|nr:TetR/AcrR family transcriptional regulator [Methanobrevibacter sp.]MBR0270646.1 TetR/AcrR family transcriptional regulator [Methanobrevibacter sp.]
MNTKKLILEKTLKLMIEQRNSIVSIRQISDATGIATGGIYYYFSGKEDIYNEITERYFINYIQFDMDKLRQIKGNAKEKIHDAMTEMFKQKQSGIEFETIDVVDYRIIGDVLTANGFTYENSQEIYKRIIKQLNEFFTEIIEEGQNNREIRQDIPTEDIVYSLINMYMGIQYQWDIYWIDDMISAFEDNFDLEWEKIRFKE